MRYHDKRARDQRHEARRGSARQRGYTRTWDKARHLFLMEHPWCRMCEQEGKITAANVVDHSTPHRGDMRKFWDESVWVPLCTHHHSSDAQSRDRRGYVRGVDVSGMPLDPNHPWSKRTSKA